MLTAKYLRAHATTAGSLGFNWFIRTVYEFWGFCVNGGSSLTAPGGFAAVSGVFVMPTNWESGSTVLLASGSDGFTSVGLPFFNTVSPSAFSASWVGKWITTWQSGSTSTDDSIYQITKWISSSSIRINVFQGGTPYTGSLHPSLTTRSSINWRIIDYVAAAAMAVNFNTSSLILQFNGATVVNSGSALCQARIRMQNQQGFGPLISMSPSGSWGLNPTGSYSFSDATVEQLPLGNAQGWMDANSTEMAFFSLFGAQDFLIAHFKDATISQGSGFHIEIPQRLYPQGVDPNPITSMIWGFTDVDQLTSDRHYAGGFYMHNPPDGSTMQYFGMARRFDGSDTSAIGQGVNGRYNGAYYNTYQNKFLFVDVILANPQVPGQYQMARARLRRCRMIAPIIPQFQRVGNTGEWLHIINGVMWPWDNTLLPYNLMLGGS